MLNLQEINVLYSLWMTGYAITFCLENNNFQEIKPYVYTLGE